MKNLLRLFLALITCVIFFSSTVDAALIENHPTKITQPDGTVIECLISGDEFYRRLHDKDDFTIIKHPETGWYVYAVNINGELIPTDLVYGDANPESNNLSKRAMINPSILKNKRQEHYKFIKKPNQGKKEVVQTNNTGTIQNVVIYIRFADDSEYSDDSSTYHSMFNATSGNSMYSYFREVSYNSLSVYSTFYPRPPSSTVKSYQDTAVRNFFRPYHSQDNPIGYQDDTEKRLREHQLLKNAVEAVESEIPSNLVIDNDNDGFVDNVCFVIKGSTDDWSDLLWPHMWSLWSYTVTINGKRVWGYNFHLQNFLKSYGNGVLSHEMFHTLGSPDLYHYSQDNMQPAGPWDLMGSTSNPPQHMGAYMKYRYGGWISTIPEITQNGTYQLNPLTSSSGNAYWMASPNTTSEIFLFEYRKTNSTFESGIPGSGLLVYRIIQSEEGNADGPPDEVYIYRPGGTTSSRGTPTSAHYSSGTGRTEINNTTNPRCFLSNNADGGLELHSVGSAGNTISFSIGTGINPPTLISPEDEDGTIAIDISLIWSEVADASTYDVQVSTNSNFTSTVFNQTGISDTTITVSPDLSYGTTYYWRVRSVGSSESDWTDPFSFTTALSTPNLVSPADAEYAVSLTGAFEWQSVSSADNYQIEISQNSNFSSIDFQQSNISATSFVIPEDQLEHNTIYYWRIMAFKNNPGTRSDWSEVRSFTSILASPEPLIPVYDSLGVEQSGTFYWSSVSGADSYKLQASKNVNFSNLDINQASITDTTFSFSNLSYDATYFWKVQAVNSNQESEWSEVFRFKTLLKPPTLISPENAATQVIVDAELIWTNVSSGDSYHLQVATDTNMNSLVINESAIDGDTNYVCSNLTSKTRHFWRVKAISDDNRESMWSSINFFTTMIGRPTIPNPSDSAEDVPISGDLIWNGVGGAERYHVQLSTDNVFSNLLVNDTNIVGESYYYEDLTPGNTYFWRVKAVAGSSVGDWSDTWQFSTGMGRLELLSPVNGATSVQTSGKLRWDNMAGAQTFELMVSLEPDFSSTVVNQTGLNSNEYTYNDFESNTIYHWKARAVNESGPAQWSATWHFTTSAGEPSPLSPVDGQGGMRLSDTLLWAASPGAQTYKLQISEYENMSERIVDEEGIANTFYIYSGFDYFNSYYWRVRASNNDGDSPWSEVQSFITMINTPELYMPENNEHHVDIDITLEWDAVAGAESYALWLSEQSDFSDNVVEESSINGVQYDVSSLEHNTKYFWKVRANNTDRNSEFSYIWMFTTAIGCPALSNPTKEAVDVKYEGQFTWFNIVGADKYHIQVAKDENFSNIVIDETDLTTNQFYYTDLEELTIYYWRVGASNEYGSCEWSEVWSFTTKDPTGVNDLTESSLSLSVQPNPFNEFLSISIDSDKQQKVEISLYDTYGKKVHSFDENMLIKGNNVFKWFPDNISSGSYELYIKTEKEILTKQIVFIK